MKTFRKNIRYLRKQKNYTIKDLGNILGVTASHISMFESGYGGFSLELFMKCCILFQVTADELLFEDLEKRNKK